MATETFTAFLYMPHFPRSKRLESPGRAPRPSAPPSAATALIAVLVLTAGCQKQSASKAPDRAAAIAQAIDSSPLRMGAPDSARAPASLAVVSPDTIVTAHHKPQMITFQVQYTIAQPALVKRAVLQLSNEAVGVIDSVVLPAKSEGTGTWTPTRPLSIGPLVLFTAHCPGGDTPPFVWGANAQPTNTSPAIISVTPTHVPAAADDPNSAHTIPVSLAGNSLGPGCTVQARIDRRTVALNATPAGAGGLSVVVNRRDLGPDPIYTRWFDLKFILRGPHAGAQSVARVPVAVAE